MFFHKYRRIKIQNAQPLWSHSCMGSPRCKRMSLKIPVSDRKMSSTITDDAAGTIIGYKTRALKTGCQTSAAAKAARGRATAAAPPAALAPKISRCFPPRVKPRVLQHGAVIRKPDERAAAGAERKRKPDGHAQRRRVKHRHAAQNRQGQEKSPCGPRVYALAFASSAA